MERRPGVVPAILDSALAQPLTIPREAVPGVNLTGFLEGELGLGEVARKLARALAHANVPFSAIPYRRTPSRQQHPLELVPSGDAPYDTNLICLNADQMRQFASDVGLDFFARRHSIGMWFWESSVFQRDHAGSARFLDEVWVASDYVRRAVAGAVDIPVHVVPLPIEEPSPPARRRSALGVPEGFLFLYVFDFVSAERKNPLAVVDAFTRAFEPDDGAVLVMKSVNGAERKPHMLQELRTAVAGRSDIRMFDEYFSADDKDALIAACDCYVSLHRSEGFGLTMAEAMACGRPVVATGYSGNLEFMTPENSFLVPYRLVPVPADWWASAPEAQWAEPDVDAAAALMREVYDNREAAQALGARGRDSILRALSLEQTAEFIANHLLGGRPAIEPRASEARTLVLQASGQLDREVGVRLAAANGRAGLLRRLLAKALWPYLDEQRRLNMTTLEAVAALQRSVDDLARRVAELESTRTKDRSD